MLAERLIGWHQDARARTLELADGLSEDQWMGPRLPIVNPMRWEVGHVGWFQELWTLRHVRGESPLRADGDRLYDSARIPHDVRWDLPLPSVDETRAYAQFVLDRALERLSKADPTPEEVYFHTLAIFHEDMHDEAFTYTRQTHGWVPPRFVLAAPPAAAGGALAADARVPGGPFALGAPRDVDGFVFDNEKWAHEVWIEPFSIARAAVTNAEVAAFVDDGGYRRPEVWCADGRAWLAETGARYPLYWRPAPGGWERRAFDRWVPLEPHHPAIHVSWFEADAWCRWAGRRLPTEAEWEAAAAGEPGSDGRLSSRKRSFPWGDSPPGPSRANLDGAAGGCVDVGALPAGDSAFGCRQMIGNVWEWTSTAFGPYPGFVADPYKEYSEPWFGNHKVLRGGCWTTRGRLLRNTWRNFYTPDRRDVFGGFRTCALG